MENKLQDVHNNLKAQILIREIRPLINKKLIEEHRSNPIGHHSEELLRVLYFLRNTPLSTPGKYIIVCTKPHKEWCIGVIGEMRGIPVKIIKDKCFTSREEAEHQIFLQRLKDLGLDELIN